MTSAREEFRTLHEAQAGLDKAMFLGRFCWYYVRDLRINRDEFCRVLIANGLREFLPRPPADSEAFRRICTATQRNRVATYDPKTYANYLVRDVGHNKEFIFKKIVRETVNTADRRLNHNSELCNITFSKKTKMVTVTCSGTADVVATQMAADIMSNYETERGTINGYGVRMLILSILRRSNAVNLRGPNGGVYFISEVHGAYLDGLEALAAAIPDGAVMFHTHGLLDDTKQRLMLRAAYESETVKEVNGAIAELTALIRDTEQGGKKIPAVKIQPFLSALNGAKAKDREYADLLSTGMSTSSAKIKIFQSLVLKASTLQ